jgi:hypothetical protein
LLTVDQLKQAVHRQTLTKTDTILLCLAANGGKAAQALAIRKSAMEAGVKKAKDLNIGAYLHSVEDKAFKTPKGWELTDAGRQHVASLAAKELAASPAAAQALSLRQLLPKIQNADAREFIMEAIVCSEQSLFRAAVVLSWAGAIAVLHDHVVAKHLTAFNAEAKRLNPKWKAAKTSDDLGIMKEYDFLQIIRAISVIGQNVKQQLEAGLKLRNACGHPNSFKVGANNVASHLETLIQNVFAKFV